MTNYFFERNWPEICRGLHKWCCERILRHFRLFRAKKISLRIGNFLTFFAYPGSQISWKMANYFFEKYRPEICRGLHKLCCERILRRFGSFQAKKKFFGYINKAFKVVSSEKKFFQKFEIFWLFCISGVTDFVKNDQLLFWEIRAWNFSWTARMVLRKNFKAF